MEKHISWLPSEEEDLEKKVLADYSRSRVNKHLEYLTTLTRRAGTEDELKAARYIKDRLEEYGVDAELHEIDAYISLPGEAELEILSPIQAVFPCLPRIFIASTPPAGMEGELIFLGKGLEKDYHGVDVRNKIVLLDVGGMEGRMDAARIGQEKGVAAQVHITTGKLRVINFGQFRTTWGTPTLETLDEIPKIPALSICEEDGKYLAELIGKGPVMARLKAEAWRGYKTIRLPVGTIAGTSEPEKYLLLAGHYCSWFLGATDNAVANSLMLEMARIFSQHRKSLGRGIRFAWWSGHEQGTYAGSTWYLDHFWDDIRDNAIAYLVMDGLGRQGSAGFEARNTEEIRKFQEKVIKDVLGLRVESKRVPRFGDQSYWGMGIPSLMGKTAATEAVWYSHTWEDTLDKVDLAAAETSFKVFAVEALRLCNNPVLPFEFVTVADHFKMALDDLQHKNSSTLELTSLMTQVDELARKAGALNQAIESNLLRYKKGRTSKLLAGKFAKTNRCLMDLSRILIPVLSSKAGRYGQDPMGTEFKSIPALRALERLGSLDAESEEYKARRTSLLRERNKVSDALHTANGILQEALDI